VGLSFLCGTTSSHAILQQIPLLPQQASHPCEVVLSWDNRARWDTAVPNGRKPLLPMGSAFLKPAHGSFCLAWGSRVSFDLEESPAVQPSLAPLFLKNSVDSAWLELLLPGGTWLAACLSEKGHLGSPRRAWSADSKVDSNRERLKAMVYVHGQPHSLSGWPGKIARGTQWRNS
jgi:hypothetical protein